MLNFKKLKKACLIIIGFFIINSLQAQNQKEADSLKVIYESNELKGNDLFEVLKLIAEEEPNPNERIRFAQKLINLAQSDSNHLWMYRGYMQKGNALRRKGDLESALKAYFNSAGAAQKIDYKAGLGGALLSIGAVYANNNDHIKGIKYRKEAIDILRNTSDSVTLATALMNTGYGYYLINKNDSALSYFGESELIFKLKEVNIGIAYNLGNSGIVYAKQGKINEAEIKLSGAIEILKELEDSYAITEFQIEMASIYQQKDEFTEAEKYLKSAISFAIKDRLKERIRDASLKLSEVYQSKGEYQKAYKYQSQYIVYRDSVNNEETTRQMADLRTDYEVSQKQIEVDLLEQEKRTQQFVGYAMAAVLVLIIVLAIVLYRTGKQRQLTNNLLARQKRTVETQRDTMESQRDQLEGLNKTKDRFFSIISHDLRGPVNAFAGVAELIRYYVEDKAYDDLLEVTEHIDQSSSQLSALLDNLLNWAVSQQGEFPYAPEQVNISEMTTELQGVFQNMSSAKNIELAFEVGADVSAFVDRNSTMTILRNLIGNALKFTESEGTITLSADVAEDQTIIKVQDTGVGIPQEKLSTLFQLLEKKSTWGTDGEKGIGLGLQLAFDFAAMNKGSISVESEEGVGTTFTVVLPNYVTENPSKISNT